MHARSEKTPPTRLKFYSGFQSSRILTNWHDKLVVIISSKGSGYFTYICQSFMKRSKRLRLSRLVFVSIHIKSESTDRRNKRNDSRKKEVVMR
jgi:hypothetical protein